MTRMAEGRKEHSNPLHGLRALTSRELTKWFKNPIVFILTVSQPVIWLGLLGKGLNISGLFSVKSLPYLSLTPPATQQQFLQISAYFTSLQSHVMTSYFGVTDYFSYLACSLIIFLTLMATTYSSMSVVLDRRFGFIDKLLTTSVSKTTFVMGKIVSGALRALVQAIILLGIAFLFGITIGTNFRPYTLLGAVAIIFIFGMGMSSIFVAVSLRSTRMETQSAFINFVNIPLVFASNAFFPASLMPNWLQTIVNVNPTTYAIDAVRTFLINRGGLSKVTVDFAYVGTFALITIILSVVLAWRYLNK